MVVVENWRWGSSPQQRELKDYLPGSLTFRCCHLQTGVGQGQGCQKEWRQDALRFLRWFDPVHRRRKSRRLSRRRTIDHPLDAPEMDVDHSPAIVKWEGLEVVHSGSELGT